MPNEPEKNCEGPWLKLQVGRQPARAPRRLQLVASSRFGERRNAFNKGRPNRAVEEVRKAMEDKGADNLRSPDESSGWNLPAGFGHALAWLPLVMVARMSQNMDDHENAARAKLFSKFRSLFGRPEPQEKLENWRARFASKKEQSTQTDFVGEPCPLCMREEDRRLFGRINLGKPPSIVDPAKCNKYTREASIECPDTTYYDSSQLVFFCVGKYAYRGWTYLTPDGRVEHMPRVPRAIPLDQLRVDPPRRAPAPR